MDQQIVKPHREIQEFQWLNYDQLDSNSSLVSLELTGSIVGDNMIKNEWLKQPVSTVPNGYLYIYIGVRGDKIFLILFTDLFLSTTLSFSVILKKKGMQLQKGLYIATAAWIEGWW